MTPRMPAGMARAARVAAGAATVVRHGPRLAALAELVCGDRACRDRGDDLVLVDRDGPVTRAELRAAADAVRSSKPCLQRIPGTHDRSCVAAVVAAALDGSDVMVVHPSSAGVAPPAAPLPRGRVWLGTSGTTRRPRHSARSRYGVGLLPPVAQLWRRWSRGQPGGPLLLQPPLHHGYGFGLLLAGLLAGRPVLLPSGDAVLAAMLRRHPGITASSPAQLARLVDLAEGSTRSGGPEWRPRVMITGSGPLPVPTQRRVERRFGRVLHNLYGSTEAGFATIAGPDDLSRSPGCVGRPLPGVGVRVVTGRVLVRSPFATAGPGWVATGDRGHWDDHGSLVLDGRADRIAVVDGVNIDLDEVAAVLRDHPAVASVDVTAQPDPVTGQRVLACVRLECAAPTAELHAWLRDRAGPRCRVVISAGGPDPG